MKIALIGYGKMGKTIEAIALERGHDIVAKVNSNLPVNAADLSFADVAIEFSRPELAPMHIRHCADIGLPVVVGTTAWLDELTYLEDYVKNNNGTMLYSSNFSIGVNIFFEINKHLAKLMTGRIDYKAGITEIHHMQKLDAPSGTAITLANGILENNPDYLSWVLGEGKSPHTNDNQLGVTSLREPDVPGTHTITYASEVDTITISHEAHNRQGFALGAVVAAEWVFGKKGVYTMSNVLNLQ